MDNVPPQILVDRAHIPESLAIERQRTGAHTVRAGKLRPLGVLLPNRRKSPELATRHRPSEKSAGSFFFRSLPLARTSDFCAGRRNSFAEASSALPQIAPVPLPSSGLPDFSAPARKKPTSTRKANGKCLHIEALHDPRRQDPEPHRTAARTGASTRICIRRKTSESVQKTTFLLTPKTMGCTIVYNYTECFFCKRRKKL